MAFLFELQIGIQFRVIFDNYRIGGPLGIFSINKEKKVRLKLSALTLFALFSQVSFANIDLPHVTLHKGDQVVHILGTEHFKVRLSSLSENQTINHEIEQANSVYTETDGIHLISSLALFNFFSLTSLEKKLTPKLYGDLRSYMAKKWGREPGRFFDYLSLFSVCILVVGETANDISIDSEVRQIALQKGTSKTLDSPWTDLNSIRVAADLTEKECNPDMISQMIRGPAEKVEKKFSDASLLNRLRKLKSQDPFSFKNLLEDRNSNWVSQLIKDRSPSVFVAVGAAHLYGQEGIINQMIVNGFTPDNPEQVAKMWDPLPISPEIVKVSYSKFASCAEESVESMIRKSNLVGKFNCSLYDCSIVQKKHDAGTCLYFFSAPITD